MRARINEDMRVFHGHVPLRLKAGQEVKGSLAAMLLEQAPSKVTALDPSQDTGGEHPPGGLDIDGTAAEVLAWVGDDPERAREALAAEEAQEKPRSTLVKQLHKAAGQPGE